MGVSRNSESEQTPMETDKVLVINGSHRKAHDFDEILDLVGGSGWYQRRILYFFIAPFSAFLCFFVLNFVFMLSEPDHWCHVPGRLETNLTIQEWKAQTLPMEIGPDGDPSLSHCRMYPETGMSNETEDGVTCLNGWDYDLTDFPLGGTISTDRAWVCEKGDYSTQAFTANSVGSALGTIVFGWAGDRIGRRMVFMLCVGVNLVFRFISLYLTEYFSLFLLMQVLVGSSFPMIFVSCFALVAEVTAKDFRSYIYSVSWFAFVFGLCALPLISWLSGYWFTIGLVTVLPLPFMFLYYMLLPESPRWLVGVGRVDEAAEVLLDIARVNDKLDGLEDGQILELLTELRKEQSNAGHQNHGFWSLFTRRRVAKHTILLSIVWAINQMIYIGITINTTSMAGNQFLNFFILAIIELPTGILGGYLVEKAGRRWTQVAFFLSCTGGFAIAAIGVHYGSTPTIILAVIISKFSVAVTSLVVTMQTTEIYPTELRSTGTGFVSMVGSLATIFSPYSIYLGRVHVLIPYVFMAVASAVGLISSSMLPETLGQSLPETLEDANNLGINEKFWSFLPKDYKAGRRRKSTASALVDSTL